MFSKKSSNYISSKRGFSLLEVLISSAIIGIVTAIVLIKYGGFNNSVLLKNQAYEVALAFREAQVFSVSIRSDKNQFRDAYGIYVDLSSGGSNQQIILFQDNGISRGRYDGTDSIADTLVIDSRFKISQLCAVTSGGTNRCSPGQMNQLSVLFERPDFDAKFNVSNNGSTVAGVHTSASITMETVDGGTVQRIINVSSTGQITVQ